MREYLPEDCVRVNACRDGWASTQSWSIEELNLVLTQLERDDPLLDIKEISKNASGLNVIDFCSKF